MIIGQRFCDGDSVWFLLNFHVLIILFFWQFLHPHTSIAYPLLTRFDRSCNSNANKPVSPCIFPFPCALPLHTLDRPYYHLPAPISAWSSSDTTAYLNTHLVFFHLALLDVAWFHLPIKAQRTTNTSMSSLVIVLESTDGLKSIRMFLLDSATLA